MVLFRSVAAKSPRLKIHLRQRKMPHHLIELIDTKISKVLELTGLCAQSSQKEWQFREECLVRENEFVDVEWNMGFLSNELIQSMSKIIRINSEIIKKIKDSERTLNLLHECIHQNVRTHL